MSDIGYFSVLSYYNLLKHSKNTILAVLGLLILSKKPTFIFLAKRSHYNYLAITDKTNYLIKQSGSLKKLIEKHIKCVIWHLSLLITSKYPNNVRHFSKKNFFSKMLMVLRSFSFSLNGGGGGMVEFGLPSTKLRFQKPTVLAERCTSNNSPFFWPQLKA